MTINMGIGKLGPSTVNFIKKFRWTIEFPELGIQPCFIKLSTRPNLKIEETEVEEKEINYLSHKTWIPGKSTWESLTVTYCDCPEDDENMKKLYGWLSDTYEFEDKKKKEDDPVKELGDSLERLKKYSTPAVLTLYDGCGMEIEKWTLLDAYPKAVNFSELDFSASDCMSIELTLGYTDVKYENAAVALKAKEAHVESKEEPFCSTGNYWMDIEALASHQKAKGVERSVDREKFIKVKSAYGASLVMKDSNSWYGGCGASRGNVPKIIDGEHVIGTCGKKVVTMNVWDKNAPKIQVMVPAEIGGSYTKMLPNAVEKNYGIQPARDDWDEANKKAWAEIEKKGVESSHFWNYPKSLGKS